MCVQIAHTQTSADPEYDRSGLKSGFHDGATFQMDLGRRVAKAIFPTQLFYLEKFGSQIY